jgi:hypothetical protein
MHGAGDLAKPGLADSGPERIRLSDVDPRFSYWTSLPREMQEQVL